MLSYLYFLIFSSIRVENDELNIIFILFYFSDIGLEVNMMLHMTIT